MKNLVTVYITNYNYGSFLEKSIQSVLKQSYKKLFLIMIDDNSKDNSRKILLNYKKKNIRIFFNKKKRGLIKSANLALKHSKGNYILRLDADDYLHKNAIKDLIKSISEKKKSCDDISKFL